MIPKSIKERAVRYRESGLSYSLISEKLGLSKSTLSDWLKEIPFKPNERVLKRVKIGQLKSAIFKQQQRINNIQEMRVIANKEIGDISKRDLFMIGIGVYLGEGTKLNENIRIVNSDPKIIKIAIRWFRDTCGLDLNNFSPRVHAYPDSDVKKIIQYWSGLTKIPINQFKKTQIDRRTDKVEKKKNKLPYGTLHLQIISCGNKSHGRSLFRRIMGWIETIENQI